MTFADDRPDAAFLRARGSAQADLHARARATARERFGNAVFVRAVVEISNYCRQNCAYCGMRRDNRDLHRYRAGLDHLAELLLHHRPASVTDVNIQAGEDPVAVREIALPLVRILRRETSLGISVCLGNLPDKTYAELREAGASIAILKFETADAARYLRFEAPGTLPERTRLIRHLASSGWKVSSGFIAGLPGTTAEDVAAELAFAAQLPLAGCSISPFIPGEATPLGAETMADLDLTLNGMALLRLLRPDWVIPAVSALNLPAPGEGYRRGLNTGANLVTINLTPTDVRGNYLLYKRDRFIMTEERILSAVAAEGLAPSTSSLASWLANRPERAATLAPLCA